MQHERLSAQPAAAIAFAAAIAERHGQRLARAADGRTWYLGPRPRLFERTLQWLRVQVAPRIALVFASNGRALAPPGGAAPARGGLPTAPGMLARTLRHEHLLTRLAERERRVSLLDARHTTRIERLVEAVTHPRAAPPEPAPRARADLPRTLARAGAAPPAAAHEANPQSVDGWRERVPESARPFAPRGAIANGNAPLDMGRITREVLRAIDDRAVAHRERMGRA